MTEASHSHFYWGIVIRILLADDSRAVREALRRLLEQHDQWTVCGEAATGREALAGVQRLHPDVVLLDFKMPDMNGLETARAISHRANVPILLVSMFLNDQLTAEARKAGVQGTCPKEQVSCLIQAVEAVLRKETYFPSWNSSSSAERRELS
jgi:DNA-binding NarL/FixJ family response regulator